MTSQYFEILTSTSFPTIICTYSEQNPNSLTIHTLKNDIFKESVVKVGNVSKDACVKLWSWNQSRWHEFPTVLTFAFCTRASVGPPALFVVNLTQNQYGDYFINNHIELMKDSYLAGLKIQRQNTSSDITIEQIYWQPIFGKRIAVRLTESNQFFGIILWEFVRGSVPENDDCGKPTHLVEEPVAQMRWYLINAIHYITASNPRASLKYVDVSTGSNQVIYNFETKAQITEFQVDAAAKHFSYFYGNVLSINQGNSHLYDIDMGKKTVHWTANSLVHEWNPHVPNQLMIHVKTPNQFCLIDLFYSEPSEGTKLSIPPLLRWFDLESEIPRETFCWAPWKREGSCDVILFQTKTNTIEVLNMPSYLCSSGFDQHFNLCAVRTGSIFSVENAIELSSDTDISTLMQWRVQSAYGPNYHWSPDLFQNDADLQSHWNRLNHLKQCSQKNMGKHNERLVHLFNAVSCNVT